MAGISQVIRWRQGRALVTPKRAKLQKAAPEPRQAPAGSEGGASSDSATVNLGGNNASQGSNATYTDRLRRNKLRPAAEAAKAQRARSAMLGGGTPSSSTSTADGATVADAHVREALAHFAKVAKAGRGGGNGDGTPAQTPPVSASSQVAVETDWSVTNDEPQAASPDDTAEQLAEAAKADVATAEAARGDTAAPRSSATASARPAAAHAATAPRHASPAPVPAEPDPAPAEDSIDSAPAPAGPDVEASAAAESPVSANSPAEDGAEAPPAPDPAATAASNQTVGAQLARATHGGAAPGAEAKAPSPDKAEAGTAASALHAQQLVLGAPAAARGGTPPGGAEPLRGLTAVAAATRQRPAAAAAAERPVTAYASLEARKLWQGGREDDPATPHFDLRS